MEFFLKKLPILLALLWANNSYPICIIPLVCYQSVESNSQELNESFTSNESDNSPILFSSARIIDFWNLYFDAQFQSTAGNDFILPKTPFIQNAAYQALYQYETNAGESKNNLSQSAIATLLSEDSGASANILFGNLATQLGNFNPNSNLSLNIDSLLNTLTLHSTDAVTQAGINYIGISCGLLSPLEIKFSNNPPNPPDGLPEKDWKKHLSVRWGAISKQSICFHNHYRALTKKMIQGNSNNYIQINTDYLISKDTSPEEAYKYQSIRRTDYPNWSNTMNTQMDIVNAKDHLYTLAELHWALLKKYKDREIYLSNITTLIAQNADSLQNLQETMESINKSSTNTNTQTNTDNNNTTPTNNTNNTSNATSNNSNTSSNSGPSFCFIATSLFGKDSPEVKTLRAFRDKNLANNLFKRTLVDSYYILSPDIIYILENHHPIKYLTKTVLSKTVFEISKNNIENNPPTDYLKTISKFYFAN